MVGRFTASWLDVAGIGDVCIMSQGAALAEICSLLSPLTARRLLNTLLSLLQKILFYLNDL